MKTVLNSIHISGSTERVYQACTDIDRWPDIFATCRGIRRTQVSADEVIMEMTVVNALGENTVRSHRRYQPSRSRIEFTMHTLPPAIAAMAGHWQVEPADGGSKVVVVHEFTAAAGHNEQVVSQTLFDTTNGALNDLKRFIEAGQDLADDSWRELYQEMRTSSSKVSAETFKTCDLFFSRLGLCGLDWGDIAMVLKHLKKDNTHEDWEDWHRRWSALGSHYEQLARKTFADGLLATGRVAIQRAIACFHFAEFFYFDAPDVKNATRAKVTQLFDNALPYLAETIRPLRIPYSDIELPGYLFSPPGEAARPTVILINGLDAAKEVEMIAFARAFVDRGMNAIVFEGPGQGVFNGHQPMPLDFERAVGAALAEAQRQPEVNGDRVGLFGVSFGGYLATRAAALLPGIKACISLSGGFDHDNYPNMNVMVRKDFRYVFGVTDDEAMAELSRTRLNLRDVTPIKVPLLSVHAELDSITPLESCERLLEWAAGETELFVYRGTSHVAPEHFGDSIPRLGDWMANRLGVKA